MTIEKLGNIEVQSEIEKGRIWRAKELLRQEIKRSGYNEILFSAYADVLSMMHDDLEAGKYYFLAGLKSEDQKRKIEIFLERHNYKRLVQLTSQFPLSAKYKRIEEFPNQQVVNDLKSLDLSEPTLEEKESTNSEPGSEGKLIILGLIVLFISVPVGILTIIYWFWKLISKIFG